MHRFNYSKAQLCSIYRYVNNLNRGNLETVIGECVLRKLKEILSVR